MTRLDSILSHARQWFQRSRVRRRAEQRPQRLESIAARTRPALPEPTMETLEPRVLMNIDINPLGTFETNIFDDSAAEIVVHDPDTQRLFFTSSADAEVTILDIVDPTNPTEVGTIDVSNVAGFGATGGPNSVAVSNGVVAVAIEADTVTDPGIVAFYDTDGTFLNFVTVGALPDMLTFTPDGQRVLVANEGEPDGGVNPEGSVSIIDVSGGVGGATVSTADFNAFDGREEELRNRGVRVFPGETASEDFEPEYISISPDGTQAFVTLQEANSFAVLDLTTETIVDILPMGVSDHSQGLPAVQNFTFDNLPDITNGGAPLQTASGQTVAIGGFSGLDYVGQTDELLHFVTIPDRGPNPNTYTNPVTGATNRPFALPDYQARIVHFDLNTNTGEISITNETFLNRQDGTTPITGLSNFGFDTMMNQVDEIPVDTLGNPLPFDEFGGDFEGIVTDTDGTFWMVDEYRPAIYHFQANGTLIDRFIPQGTAALAGEAVGTFGTETLPAEYVERRRNRGFEAVALDTDNDVLYAFIQTPLANPNRAASDNSDVIRVLGISTADGSVVEEYVYLLEGSDHRESKVDKIGDAFYVGDGQFYVIERDSATTATGKKFIYKMDLLGATNLRDGGAPALLPGMTLEEHTADELAGQGIVPVNKIKVTNLPSIGYLAGDKPEGLVMLPNGDLVVLNDNDFTLADVDIFDGMGNPLFGGDVVFQDNPTPATLGIISFGRHGNGIDPSDRDDAIDIRNGDVYGMFMPDTITSYESNGVTYYLTANEGDDRGDFPDDVGGDASRIKDLMLDPARYDAAFSEDDNFGRLNASAIDGDLDGDGDLDQVFSYGSRSFTIFDQFGNLVFNSGDDFERIIGLRNPDNFNSNNDENDSFESRSDNKGPEPEAIEIGQVGGRTYAFIGMERHGGIMVYDVTDPAWPQFVDFVNNRDFTVANAEASVEGDGAIGDLGPESIKFISADESPTGAPLLAVGNEVSGTVTMYTVTPRAIDLNVIGTHQETVFDDSAAEIVAHDPASQRVFFTSSANDEIGVLDIADPANPIELAAIDVSTLPGVGATGGPNSVSVHDGVVAVAIEAATVTDPGFVAFYDVDGNYISHVTVGALPDMLTFTPDGNTVLVANEGEPDGGVNPKGSVSLIDVSGGAAGVTQGDVQTAGFTAFDGQEAALRAMGVRIFDGISTSDDVEPEYIAVSPDGTQAFVTLQEANAFGVLDIATATITDILPLGFKDHSIEGNGLDPSDRDDAINIRTGPVFGMYMPDTIASFEVGGTTYYVTANEGDDRGEDERIKDLTLDPTAFPDAATFQMDENFGRLGASSLDGDTDGDGDFDELYVYGGRSFSIYDENGNQVFDSGDDFERILAELFPADFNSNNDENDSFESRSDNKGPEPEAIEVGMINGRIYTFIGLERQGGIMVYDVTDPTMPHFVDYLNNRNFEIVGDDPGDAAQASVEGDGAILDLAPESIEFISAADSPINQPMLAVANEVSGSVTFYSLTRLALDETVAEADYVLSLFHNNDGESQLINASGQPDFGGAARFKSLLDQLRQDATANPLIDGILTLSSGDNFLAGPEFTASLATGDLGDRTYFDQIVLEAIGYDAIQIGNHDFDFGPDLLADFIGSFDAPVPYLAANLDFTGTPLQPLFDAGQIERSTIVNTGGEMVGIVGAITPGLASISSPGGVTLIDENGDMQIDNDDTLISVQREIDLLEGMGVNKIILISHLQDINEELDLVQGLSGIDVVIAGGGDELLTNAGDPLVPGDDDIFGAYPQTAVNMDGNTVPVVTTPGEYKYVGNLNVGFDAAGNVVSFDGRPIRVSGTGFDAVEGDTQILMDVVAPVADFVDGLDQNVIADSEVPLNGVRGDIRTVETNLGNLIADSFLSEANRLAAGFGVASGAQVAMANGGGIRNNNIIPAGDITELDTFDILPFGNFLTIVEAVSPQQLKELVENAVSNVEGVSGRFAQIAGMRVVYDISGTPQQIDSNGNITQVGSRVQSITLDDGTAIVAFGEVVGGAPNVNVATADFLARGGDQYPFGDNDFTVLGISYQQALFNFITNDLGGEILASDYPEGGSFRTQQTDLSGAPFPDTSNIDFEHLATIGLGGAEIAAYDAASQRVFVTGASVSIVDISNPSNPVLINTILNGTEVTSVAVHNGLVAAAVPAATVTAPGMVMFMDINGNVLSQVTVGALPDMLTFTPDGNTVLVALEGEPRNAVDPLGGVALIDVSGGGAGVTQGDVTTADFTAFNGMQAALEALGAKFDPEAPSIAADIEPEYIAVSPDGTTAFITLQEINAVGILDIATATITDVVPLGFKDHSLPGNGLDASNRDNAINIQNWPVFGLYQPDAIASYSVGGQTYYITANEGDAREVAGRAVEDDDRIGDYDLDPTAFPNAEALQENHALGRLKTTSYIGDTDGDGDLDQLFSFGARSFSIWDSNGDLVFDSGDEIARITAALVPEIFNQDEGDIDDRSDDKGAEPEGVTVGQVGGRTYAFIGLERTGGVLVYDVTDPMAPVFQQYLNNAGDMAPEGLVFVSEGDSPNGASLLLVTNEDSNTLTIYSDAEPGIETVLDATDGQVSFVDGNGTTVRIRLNGDGQVTVRQNTAGDITRITVDGSTDRSNLTINTVGNNDTTVGDIFINGSLRNLNGRQVDLGGDLIVTGVIHNIRLDDVDNDHLIEIQGEGAEPNDRVTMHFDNVTDTEINSAIGINRLTVTGTWDDTDGLPDLIVAPWINTLNAREDFSVGLDLSGEFSPNRFTLRNANIRGDITDADWLIFGDMGRLRVDDVINFSLELNSSFRNLRFDEMINTDISVDGEAGTIQAHEWLSGSLTAETLRTLRVIERFGANLSLFGVFDGNQPSIRNIRVGEIAGGVWEVLGEAHNVITDRIDMAWNATFEGLRNLNVRGRASGNLTADWIGRFNVRNDLIDAVVNIIDRAPNGLSLARLNVRDEINNSDIRTMYDIGTVTAEQMLDSNLFAGINAGLDSLPDDAADFDTLATIRRLNLRRTRFVPSFINSNVAASEIQSFNLSDVDATNDGDTFGIATGSLRRLDYIVDDERVRLRSAGDVAAQSFDDDFLVRII